MSRFNMQKKSGGGSVVIDGREFNGNNINIDGNGIVTVDGVQQEGQLVGDIKIEVSGDITRLETTSGDVTVTGSCGMVSTMSGDVETREIVGNVKTMSGDVKCTGPISGSVSTMSGDITHR